MAGATSLFLPLLLLLLPLSQATTFLITNNCSQTIWPAATPYGGGVELPPSQNWTISTNTTNSTSGTIWARTNCTFDTTSGNGTCLSGDCGGALNCTSRGSSPVTVVEYSLYQWGNNDFYDISLNNGFNLPVDITPTGPGNCSAVKCTGDVTSECPPELKAAGGCKSACDVYKTDEYCCNKVGGCSPTKYSRFFKKLCPNAYSYPMDDPTSTFTCTSGGDYRVTFCP